MEFLIQCRLTASLSFPLSQILLDIEAKLSPDFVWYLLATTSAETQGPPELKSGELWQQFPDELS